MTIDQTQTIDVSVQNVYGAQNRVVSKIQYLVKTCVQEESQIQYEYGDHWDKQRRKYDIPDYIQAACPVDIRSFIQFSIDPDDGGEIDYGVPAYASPQLAEEQNPSYGFLACHEIDRFHSEKTEDTAAGAGMAIVVAPLMRGRIPTIVKRLNTIVTPGKTIDVVVTDQGIAVNPQRPELYERLTKAGLHVRRIEELQESAERLAGCPEPVRYTDKVVGVVTYRDGSVIDLIYQIAE